MAIDKKLIHFKKKETFIATVGEEYINTPSEGTETDGNAVYGQIKGTSIVFIKDTQEIWTHGKLYQCVNWSKLEESALFATMTIEDSNTDPAIPVTGDTSWIGGKRCLVKPTDNGVAICYLSDTDSTKFHDGTDAALDGTMGEFMVDFAENYVTATETDGVTTVEVNNAEGTTKFRRVLLGAVHGSVDEDGKLHSIITGEAPAANVTITAFHDAAVANGAGWDIMDYETRNKVTILGYAKYGTRNLQNDAIVGLGDSTYGFAEGSTVSLGNSTGIVDNSDTDGGHICNSFLGVENYFNNVADWLGGIHGYSDGETINYYIYDGVNVDTGIPSGEYRTITPSVTIAGANISKMQWGEYADLFPIASDGDTSNFATNYSDGALVLGNDDTGTQGASSVWGEAGIGVALVGGYAAYPNVGGAVFSAASAPAVVDLRVGARLQYRGNITVIENPEEFKQL